MARKRSKKSPHPGPKRKVVDLVAKRAEKLASELESLMGQHQSLLDEQARIIVGAYHDWERANPKLALQPFEKMMMVRVGFVGPGGFDRCHESGRLPEHAFFTEDGDVTEELRSDRSACEVLMCPAMQSRKCQPVWRGMRMPPCYLLLLEVHQGLGGRAADSSVEEVVEDFGRWGGPEEYAASFARAEEVLRRFEEREDSPRHPVQREEPPEG